MFTPQGRWFSGLHRSAVDAAPPQPLLRRRFRTAACRGRWRAQPSATKERYGCGPPLAGAHRPSFPVFTGTAVRPAKPQLCLRRPTFSVAPEKVGKKMRWRRVILRADARANFWPLRGLNALFGRRIVIFPIAYGSDECTTRICGQTASISVLLISGILGQSCSCTAPCRGRCLQRFTIELTILHYRQIRRCVVVSTAGCFAIFLCGNCYRWERCLHAGGAVV